MVIQLKEELTFTKDKKLKLARGPLYTKGGQSAEQTVIRSLLMYSQLTLIWFLTNHQL